MSVSQNSNVQKSTGQFFLTIIGLPSKYTWQDLKDAIRPMASRSFWANMEASLYPYGRPSAMGTVRTTHNEEAVNLYGEIWHEIASKRQLIPMQAYLTEHGIGGRPLVVHLFDLSDDSSQLVRCNCSGKGTGTHPAMSRIAHISGGTIWRSAASSSRVASAPQAAQTARHYTTPMSGLTTQAPAPPLPCEDQLAQYFARLGINQNDPREASRVHEVRQALVLRQAQYAQQQLVPNGGYANHNGLPVTTRNGFVMKEARGVFVKDLSFSARQQDVVKLFAIAGQIVECDVHRDAKGRSRGYATVLFETAEGAAKAIELFHGRQHDGMTLKVRYDKEQPTVAARPGGSSSRMDRRAATPTICNGSDSGRAQTRKDSGKFVC